MLDRYMKKMVADEVRKERDLPKEDAGREGDER